MAYMIPFFPPPVRFLRIQGYFTGPSDNPNETDRQMRRSSPNTPARCTSSTGSTRSGTPRRRSRTTAWQLDPATCVTFVPRVEPQQEHDFYFCKVTRLQP